MKQHTLAGRKAGRRTLAQGGFTLVELAIVMAVIGLIIGAVAIAKDVQRNAEYQKIANKFVFQWKQAYDQHYQRAGVVLGDCQQAPTYMFNGAETSFGSATACTRAGASGAGIPENFTNPGLKICRGQGYAKDDVGPNDAALAQQDLRDLMLRTGVRMPPGRGEGHEDRFLFIDSNGNATELQVCFQWNTSGTASGAGNVMVVRGLTPDLARFLDQLIDGKPDSREGRFRIQGRPSHTAPTDANGPGTQWEGNNTQGRNIASTAANSNMTSSDTRSAITNTAGDAGGVAAGRRFDEDRVILLTAHWSMDQ